VYLMVCRMMRPSLPARPTAVAAMDDAWGEIILPGGSRATGEAIRMSGQAHALGRELPAGLAETRRWRSVAPSEEDGRWSEQRAQQG